MELRRMASMAIVALCLGEIIEAREEKGRKKKVKIYGIMKSLFWS